MKQNKPSDCNPDRGNSPTDQCGSGVPPSYKDIKNRPPDVLKTWQELIDGDLVFPVDEDDEEVLPV